MEEGRDMRDLDSELASVVPRLLGPQVPSPGQPMDVARDFLAACYGTDPPRLIFWRSTFYAWGGSAWIDQEEVGIRAELYRRLERAWYYDPTALPHQIPWSPNKSKIANVLEALQSVAHLSREVEERSWIDYGEHWRAMEDTGMLPASGDLLPAADGLLHIPTRALHPPAERFFNLWALPHQLLPTGSCRRASSSPKGGPSAAPPHRAAECPEWLRFLDTLWPDDEESVGLLQEWFGYMLSGRTHLHKMMLMVGPPRSGKGTVARVLSALIGRNNSAGPTMSSLIGNFGLEPLIGKTLAVIADARFTGHDVGTVVERLLSISGEDDLTVDRKFKPAWHGRLGVRWMLLSNELPSLRDVSGAIATRFVILELTESWLGREDLDLERRLMQELPGILFWALDGLDRLRGRGHFTEPQSSKDAARTLLETVSAVHAFVRERCVVGPYEIELDAAFSAWVEWCQKNGRDYPGTKQTFGRDLRAAVPGLRTKQCGSRYERSRVLQGIRLRTKDDADDDDEQWSASAHWDESDAPDAPAAHDTPGAPGPDPAAQSDESSTEHAKSASGAASPEEDDEEGWETPGEPEPPDPGGWETPGSAEASDEDGWETP